MRNTLQTNYFSRIRLKTRALANVTSDDIGEATPSLMPAAAVDVASPALIESTAQQPGSRPTAYERRGIYPTFSTAALAENRSWDLTTGLSQIGADSSRAHKVVEARKLAEGRRDARCTGIYFAMWLLSDSRMQAACPRELPFFV